jgi:hypothetical protein
LRLESCHTARQWRLFERVPEILHGHDPCFVPPFPGEVAKLRSSRHPFHRDGSVRAYVAFADGRPVGRVASIVNRTHNRFHDDRIGFFGFFDFTDVDVARLLLDRVRADLRDAGLGPMRGPFNPTQNDECGLQVEGFGQRPFFLMPYNPVYYVGVYEQLGLVGARDLLAYDLDRRLEASFEQRMAGLVERIRARFGITARALDRNRIAEECALVSRLFNESLADEWNFMPLSVETAMSFVKDLIDYLEPDAMTIAEVDGRPIGLSIGLPDVNEFLADAGRLPRWLRWPRLAWLLKTRKPKQVRWAVFAMLPEYRRRGATALLIYDAIHRFKSRYQVGEMSWTQDINRHVNEIAESLGLTPSRRYRIYETAV